MSTQVDTLVIGSGIAGAAAALRLAEDTERQILLITRAAAPEESNTFYAQGGIVAQGPDDSRQQIVDDILAAGAGASLERAAAVLAEDGPGLVQEMLIQGADVGFDCLPTGELSYTKEGGHTHRRVLHVGDATGKAIQQALIRRLNELPNVTIKPEATAVDLTTTSHHVPDPVAKYEPITCLGAYVLDNTTGRIDNVRAESTVLATGGLGRIYRHTTNPRGARGDGVAMAHRAGARLINTEYVQFHPTTLALPDSGNFLISEAVRGEGAKLLTPDGRHFMPEYSPKWADLAPRDVVARAIHQEMVTHDYPHILLDVAGALSAEYIRERFPTITQKCRDAGIDITADPIPVVPAAHYACGGVLVDEWARSSISRLYAVGEVSCTGIHGANRLASTSLLEGLVWGHRAAADIRRSEPLAQDYDVPPWEEVDGRDPDPVLIHQDLQAVQDLMWYYVGLVRNARRLGRALHDLTHLRDAVESFYRNSRVTDDLLGLRNALQTAIVVAHGAWTNRQSRGAHYREDAVEETAPSLYAVGAPPASVTEF